MNRIMTEWRGLLNQNKSIIWTQMLPNTDLDLCLWTVQLSSESDILLTTDSRI